MELQADAIHKRLRRMRAAATYEQPRRVHPTATRERSRQIQVGTTCEQPCRMRAAATHEGGAGCGPPQLARCFSQGACHRSPHATSAHNPQSKAAHLSAPNNTPSLCHKKRRPWEGAALVELSNGCRRCAGSFSRSGEARRQAHPWHRECSRSLP